MPLIKFAQLDGHHPYYEAAGGSPTAEAVTKIAKVLGTTTDDLLGMTDPSADKLTPETPDERRLWRRFRQLLNLPEKDRRAVLRMLDTMTKAHSGGGGTATD